MDILWKTWEVNIYDALQKTLPLHSEKESSLAENYLVVCNRLCVTEFCPGNAYVSVLFSERQFLLDL